MAAFNANMQIIADKLTAINTSLETIAGAIADGKITVDPTLVEAVQALAFNGQTLDLGAMRVRFDGKTISVEY